MKPDKIFLFGSAARGYMRLHSDVDLLVIKSGKSDTSRLTGHTYMNVRGIAEAVDIIFFTPGQVEQYHHSHSLIIAPASHEGKEVHVSKTGA